MNLNNRMHKPAAKLRAHTHTHTVTFWLSCLDEELLLLRDKDIIFWDMTKLRSSVPISTQTS